MVVLAYLSFTTSIGRRAILVIVAILVPVTAVLVADAPMEDRRIGTIG